MKVNKNVKLIDITTLKPRIKTYSKDPKYQTYKVLTIRRKTFRIPIKRLKDIVAKLQQKYPDKNFTLERVRILHQGKLRTFWVIGRKEGYLKGVPLYYSPTLKKLFVPSSYVKRKPKLVGSVLLYRLRDLGIAYTLSYSR
jgi:hypothetical protein